MKINFKYLFISIAISLIMSQDTVVEVGVISNSFTPSHIDIEVGQTVTWSRLSGSHNVDGRTDTYSSNPDSFYSGSASSEWTNFSHTFTATGDYNYQCTPHADMGMTASITVGSSGCMDDMACNYDPGVDFDCGTNCCTYADENYDCDGNCTAGEDCAGECGGSAEEDECGECGGDGSACQTSLVDVLYNSDADIYGFQFNVDGVEVVGAGGGAADANGFSTSSGNNTVLGFSFSGTFMVRNNGKGPPTA